MTYIAALPCQDGIVMCADTQETVGINKDYSEKISIVEDLSYPLAIGGAGHGQLIDCMTDEIIERAKTEKPATKTALKALITAALREVYEKDLPAITTRRINKAPQLLVAARTSEDGFCIYQTVGRRVVGSEVSRGIIGYATPYNMNLLRRLHRLSLPMQQAVLLAVYLVSQSKKLDDGVGGQTQVVIVRDNGAWVDYPAYIANSEGRIADFMKLTDELFLSSVDISIPPSKFPSVLEKFGGDVTRLREQFLRETAAIVLNRTFSDPTYRGEPYAKIFPGATFTIPGVGPMVVHEDSPEERAKLTEMYKIMREKHNELAIAQFNEMIAGRTPLYIGQEWVHVRGTAGPVPNSGSS